MLFSALSQADSIWIGKGCPRTDFASMTTTGGLSALEIDCCSSALDSSCTGSLELVEGGSREGAMAVPEVAN